MPTPVPVRFSETGRSGTRMLVAMPVTLDFTTADGKAGQEKTRTVVVNRSGCKLTCDQPFNLGDKFTIAIGNSKRSAKVSVVWLGEKRGKQLEVGVDFDTPDPSFWGVMFPEDSAVIPPGSPAAAAVAAATAPTQAKAAAPPAAATLSKPASKPVATTSSKAAPAPAPPAPKPAPAPVKAAAASAAPAPIPVAASTPAPAPAAPTVIAATPAPAPAPVIAAAPAPVTLPAALSIAASNPAPAPVAVAPKPVKDLPKNSPSTPQVVPAQTTALNPPPTPSVPSGFESAATAPAKLGPVPVVQNKTTQGDLASSSDVQEASHVVRARPPQITINNDGLKSLGGDLLLGTIQHLVREAFQEVLTQVVEDFDRYCANTIENAKNAAINDMQERMREAVSSAIQPALEAGVANVRSQLDNAARQLSMHHAKRLESSMQAALEDTEKALQTRVQIYDQKLAASAGQFCQELAKRLNPSAAAAA